MRYILILWTLFLLVGLVGCANNIEGTEIIMEQADRPTDGMLMIHIPTATFILAEKGTGGQGRHQVTLDDYWIDQTEVTNTHYANCVKSGICKPPTTCAWGEPTFGDPVYASHPVICVTWQMAQTYCEWAGARLPSEAEWDYAARGPKRSLYAWGNDFDPKNLNYCDANCPKSETQDDDGYALTSPVGTYPNGASWSGALDMNGNVWEWIADWYAPYPRAAQENPTGPQYGTERIIRGGSWYDLPDFMCADHRHPYNPMDYNHLIGFRCAASTMRGMP